MARILYGRDVADAVCQKIKSEISELRLNPQLAIVIVGDDPASEIYIKNKVARGREVGIATNVVRLPRTSHQGDILLTIKELNADPDVNGVIVQSPLPDIAMENVVFNSISPQKDVDGFCAENVSKLVKGDISGLVPCTPLGILKLLQAYDISIYGRHVVIIGRSNIVGRPLSLLMSRKASDCNATVTLCHSATKKLKEILKLADIIVVAIGEKKFLTPDMISSGSVVVDVGINRSQVDASGDYTLSGDADFEGLSSLCSAITPVPGGVGPMTVAMLMGNVLLATKRQNGII